MRRPPAASRVRPYAAVRLACVLLGVLAVASALRAALGPPPELPASEACPPAVVLVRNARYLTRGNVGHWGYALFALHAALRRAPGAPPPPRALTLFFDARVTDGDWVRAMLAALERRHGVRIALAAHSAGRCTRPGGGSAVFATLDANDSRALAEGREPALRQAWRDVCAVAPPAGPPPADVLIYNRHAASTRRLCDLPALYGLLSARGLSYEYVDVPRGACAQVAALSAPRRFVLTPHGAHEVNLFAAWPNATVVEVMPRWTDIPIYNALVQRTVWVVSEALTGAYPCRDAACAPLPAAYGACTRSTVCRKWARNRPCVRANLAALAAVLDGGEALAAAEARATGGAVAAGRDSS